MSIDLSQIGVPSYATLLQIAFLTILTYVVYRRSRRRKQHEYTEEEKQKLIDDWHPQPLADPIDPSHYALHPKYVQGKLAHYLHVDDHEYLNVATMDFLGLVGDERIERTAKDTINKYGVGSCGPRGFYGTVDVHLDLESQIADFMRCEESALYSYGFATIASAIPAYAKRDDVIFVDRAVNFAIQKGVLASRATVRWFDHNDMNDAERVMLEQAEWDKKNASKAKSVRRFIVAEGIYVNTGRVVDLPKLLELKWRYKARIFLDESISFGVLGKHGRGVTEHFGVNVEDIDMIMVSMECALSSTGGFCVGRSFVIDHHRLSGLGYCFSASLPPLLATSAGESLRIMNAEPDRIERLRQNSKRMHTALERMCAASKGRWSFSGDIGSPILHVHYNGSDDVEKHLDAVVESVCCICNTRTKNSLLQNPGLCYATKYTRIVYSIRIALNSQLTDEELSKLETILQKALK